MLPDFVIIGAMKAASTLITECLRQHPEVYMGSSLDQVGLARRGELTGGRSFR